MAKNAANGQKTQASEQWEEAIANDVVQFSLPPKPTPSLLAVAADIVTLDHSSVRTLKPKTPEREEVKSLLRNAGQVAVQNNLESLARVLCHRAQIAYFHHLQAKNRLRYLLGVVIGVFAAGAFIIGLLLGVSSHLEFFITRSLLIVLPLFAGMGSIASVLTRLSSIDLKQETNTFLIIVSGATRPVVAIFFAIVVYLILDLKIVDVQFGSSPAEKRNGLYLVISFLCGFSERFAEDIIARVGFANHETPSAPSQAVAAVPTAIGAGAHGIETAYSDDNKKGPNHPEAGTSATE
jgi:hypothetical protein